MTKKVKQTRKKHEDKTTFEAGIKALFARYLYAPGLLSVAPEKQSRTKKKGTTSNA